MAVKIQFETTNAAFHEGHEDAAFLETARILRDLADNILASWMQDQHHVLRDLNGNRIGEAEIHLRPDS